MAIPSRYLILVNLLLLGMAAYWGASTVSTAIAARLTPMPQVELPSPPELAPPQPNRPMTHYAAISRRNIFNVEPTPGPAIQLAPQKTPLNLKLWGVSIDQKRPNRSHAIIEDQKAHKQDVHRVGDQIQGATVKIIDWTKVTLERDGQLEILELAATNLPGAAAPANRPLAAAQAGPTGEGIQKISDTEYTIERTEVDSALENMNQLFTQIRAVPHFEGGQSVGFRLFAIRQDSLFDKIGLKNGDIISKINGQDMTDPARAIAMFQELRNERQISVEVTRNKEPLSLSYSLR
jgi:general secretion pathway protein C